MAKLSYVDQLKNIAKAEAGAEKFLLKWAECAKDKDVESALRFVAMREGEHAYAFRKRVLELTGEEPPVGEADPKTMEGVSNPTMTDRQKFETILDGRLTKVAEGPDQFCKMFDNKDLDPVTGGLLGRYIAEERDSTRVLAAAYQKVAAKEPAPAAKAAAAGGGAAALVSELERLAKLRTDGVLTDQEFNAAKAAMLPASKM